MKRSTKILLLLLPSVLFSCVVVPRPAHAFSITLPSPQLNFPKGKQPQWAAPVLHALNEPHTHYLSGRTSEWPPNWWTALDYDGDTTTLNSLLATLASTQGLHLGVSFTHSTAANASPGSWTAEYSQTTPDMLMPIINFDSTNTDGGLKTLKVKLSDGSEETYFYHGDGPPVRLPGLVRGARVYMDRVAPQDYVEASRERVIVERHDPEGRTTTQIAWDLNVLRGSVNIMSKAAALRYVRLLTTPRTYYFWPNKEVEVVSRSEAPSLPRYGVESYWPFLARKSGDFGIISPRAWRIGKFTRPAVQQTPAGFIVTRWIYADTIYSPVYSPAASAEAGAHRMDAGVYRIREWIGRDGAYRRRVVQRYDKELPDTSWYLTEAEE